MDLILGLIDQLLNPPDALHAITSYAVGCMVFVFALALVLRLLKIASQFTNQASTLLTSIGILGTFLGIVIGLQGVDLTNTATEESVRTLLGGMTLAFTSSLVGMALSITYKLLLTIPPFANRAADPNEENRQVITFLQSTATAAEAQNKALEKIANAIGAGDYSGTAELLVSMNDMIEQRMRTLVDTTVSQQRQISQLNESMERLVHALVEDDVQSLTGQMRGLRTELSDRHRQHNASMTDIVESVKKQNADQTLQTQALETVATGQSSLLELQKTTAELFLTAMNDLDTTLKQDISGRLDGIREGNETALQSLGTMLDSRLESTEENIGAGVASLDETLKQELGSRLDAIREGNEAALLALGTKLDSQLDTISGSISTASELQTTSWDKLDGHLSSMKALLERSPTEEIIEALKSTIREFNEHISEQFGENFAELNKAVGRLLEWQDNYREQLGEMRDQFNISVSTMKDVSGVVETIGGNVEHIHRHTEKIPEHMAILGDVIQTNMSHVEILESHLSAFAETRDRAVESLPKISEIVEGTVQGINMASENLKRAVTESANELQSATGNLAESISSGAQELQAAFVRSLDGYVKATDSVNDTAEGISQRTQAEVIRMYDHLQETVKKAHEDSAGRNQDLIRSQFDNMERIRLEETEAVIKEMARALAQITGRFTDDYSKLVNAMGDIVKQAANDASR